MLVVKHVERIYSSAIVNKIFTHYFTMLVDSSCSNEGITLDCAGEELCFVFQSLF